MTCFCELPPPVGYLRQASKAPRSYRLRPALTQRDALSAMAQALSATAGGAAHRLLLGGVRQIVVVGATHKLALLGVSDLAIGVLAPSAVDLSTALASRSFDPKDPSDPQEPPCR